MDGKMGTRLGAILDPELRKLVEAKIASEDRAAVRAADVEQPVKHGPVAEEAHPRLDPPFRVRVVCRRKRLCDLDNLSVKAVLDGLVHEGFIEDDSAHFIRHLEVSQTKCKSGESEQTTIEFYEAEADTEVLDGA